jgi:hypothetical protein
MGRLVSIPFLFTVPAGGSYIRCSKRVTSAFITSELLASFPVGTNRTMRLRFFVASDNLTSGAALVGGTNLLAFAGQVDYMVGDDGNRRFPVQVEFKERGLYVKVEGTNTDGADHTVDCVVVLELIDVDP